MTIRQKSAFRLETTWKPAAAAENPVYSLTLSNLSAKPVEGFRLCISGPGRVDPGAQVVGGTLAAQLSNYAEFVPPDGFVLEPKGSWTVSAHAMMYNLRHWTDGATGPDPEHWLATAKDEPGSWWPKWMVWLDQHAGDKVPAPRTVGSRDYRRVEPAPGRYVKAKAAKGRPRLRRPIPF